MVEDRSGYIIDDRDPRRGYNHKERYPIGSRMREQDKVKLESSKIVVWMMLSDEEKIIEEVEPCVEQLW